MTCSMIGNVVHDTVKTPSREANYYATALLELTQKCTTTMMSEAIDTQSSVYTRAIRN